MGHLSELTTNHKLITFLHLIDLLCLLKSYIWNVCSVHGSLNLKYIFYRFSGYINLIFSSTFEVLHHFWHFTKSTSILLSLWCVLCDEYNRHWWQGTWFSKFFKVADLSICCKIFSLAFWIVVGVLKNILLDCSHSCIICKCSFVWIWWMTWLNNLKLERKLFSSAVNPSFSQPMILIFDSLYNYVIVV